MAKGPGQSPKPLPKPRFARVKPLEKASAKKVKNMPKGKVNQIEKKVAVSLPLQFKLEAKMLHLTPTGYYRWLKEKANYSTPYDQMLANYKAQQQSQSPAKARPGPEAQGSGDGRGEGEEK